jgi:hypothetical protein
LDTSALNALAKDGVSSVPYIKALLSGYEVLLTAMSVDELISTEDAVVREELIASSQRLLGSGVCVWPPHEILTLHVAAHDANPSGYNWESIDIRAQGYERAIIDRDFTDALCVQQLQEQQATEQQFMGIWDGVRSKLDPLFVEGSTKRPKNYREAVNIARSGTPNLLWKVGQGLYKHITQKDLTDAEIDAFLTACPPFRAACYGLLGSWYDVSLASAVFKKLAGRNDQMMSIYLPYCTRFVTRDKKQLERLSDVALEAQIACDVTYYDDFIAGFSVTL